MTRKSNPLRAIASQVGRKANDTHDPTSRSRFTILCFNDSFAKLDISTRIALPYGVDHMKTSVLDGKHLVQIVIKNTSTMDFATPLLWRIRKDHPGCRITVLYCTSNKRQVLGNSRWFSEFYRKYGIEERDFSNFFRTPFRALAPLWKNLFATRPSDRLSLGEIRRAGISLANPKTVALLAQRRLAPLEAALGPKLIDVGGALERLAPDLILFDNRTTSDFYGRDEMFTWMYKNRKPVVLLPHGPHCTWSTDEFVPFDERGERFPKFCDHWMSFIHGTPWEVVPEARKQFAYVGYPGLDTEWVENRMKSRQEHPRPRVLWVTRKFYPKGMPRPSHADPFTMDYDELLEASARLARAIQKSGRDVEVVVKPHPSGNLRLTSELLSAAGLRNHAISHEPFYKLLPEIDAVVSLFSTSILMPALFGIPTIVLDSSLQSFVHSKWDVLRELYTGFKWFVRDEVHLCTALGEALSNPNTKADINHVRSFFPDGACKRGTERLATLLTQPS